jgi:hypothetical protein
MCLSGEPIAAAGAMPPVRPEYLPADGTNAAVNWWTTAGPAGSSRIKLQRLPAFTRGLRQRGAAGQHDLLAATQKTSAVNGRRERVGRLCQTTSVCRQDRRRGADGRREADQRKILLQTRPSVRHDR